MIECSSLKKREKEGNVHMTKLRSCPEKCTHKHTACYSFQFKLHLKSQKQCQISLECHANVKLLIPILDEHRTMYMHCSVFNAKKIHFLRIHVLLLPFFSSLLVLTRHHHHIHLSVCLFFALPFSLTHLRARARCFVSFCISCCLAFDFN